MKAYWAGATSLSGLPRRDRQGCRYEPYIPDPLIGPPFSISGSVAADIADAERAIGNLDHSVTALADTEALARLLLRAESVASSKIEGLEVGPRRLLEADAAQEQGIPIHDDTALEVLGNVEAMRYAISAIELDGKVTLDLLLEMHRRLLQSTSIGETHGGKIRTKQNWIGGSSYNPCSAAYVPPPPDYVESLLDDLVAFCNTDDLPAVAQAAIAHAQFEAIHPFADGNGRVGRALIHVIFRRRRLCVNVSPPVSLVLATGSADYIQGLNGMCYVGKPTSQAAIDGLNNWLGTFAAACTRAVDDAFVFEARITALQDEWRARIGQVRSDSAVWRVVALLPGTPIVTTTSLVKQLDISRPGAVQAIERLEKAGILHPTRADRKRRQIFEAREVIRLFTALERQLASPAGDTAIEPPHRRVSARAQNR